jgi:phosphoserine aminotransferase
LQIPADYRIGIVPASDTGAVEMAMWSLLGERGVDMVAWESFGEGWVTDVIEAAQARRTCALSTAPYGELPDLSEGRYEERDVVFTWNGTTSGVRVRRRRASSPPTARGPDHLRRDLVRPSRRRSTIPKLDVVTFSWQKVLGGEAAHGMLVLSARALSSGSLTYKPAWPLPKIFRHDLRRQAHPKASSSRRDDQHALHARRRGLSRCAGLGEGRSVASTRLIEVAPTRNARCHRQAFVRENELVARPSWRSSPKTRSNTSVCLKFVDRGGRRRSPADGAGGLRQAGRVDHLEKEPAWPATIIGALPRRPFRPAHLVPAPPCKSSRPQGADALARLGLRRGRRPP